MCFSKLGLLCLKWLTELQSYVPPPPPPPTTVLWPFFQDHLGEPVPEENFWTSWCKGRLTEADTLTIRLGTTPSGLISAHLHHPPHTTIINWPAATILDKESDQSTRWIKEAVHIRNNNNNNHFMAIFPGPPGWASARRELLDFMVQGKINRGRHIDYPAGRHSIRTNQCPPPSSPYFYELDALPATQPTVSKDWRQLPHSD